MVDLYGVLVLGVLVGGDEFACLAICEPEVLPRFRYIEQLFLDEENMSQILSLRQGLLYPADNSHYSYSHYQYCHKKNLHFV